MLKLKYLFDNSELALMLLKNWNYDEDSLVLFKYFRISSNAIYPFKSQGKIYFLRFVPATEKDSGHICQELEFMKILSKNDYHVPNVIESRNGNFVETKNTPWGVYHAVVFESVGDETLESIEITEDIAYQYGQSLARLHELSKREVQLTLKRRTIFDVFSVIENKFNEDIRASSKLLAHLNVLRKAFDQIERTKDTFGLIHYDYELDNIVYDRETQSLSTIDFDDCMYGFYVQDVERAVNSIESEIEEHQEMIKARFFDGYLDAGGRLDLYYQNRAIFKAFADLYTYFRVSNSLEEKWDNEPEWMVKLREKLSERMDKYLDSINGVNGESTDN